MAEIKKELEKAETFVSEQLEKLPEPVRNSLGELRGYAKKNPDTALLWCFGIGFVLGWKLKPW